MSCCQFLVPSISFPDDDETELIQEISCLQLFPVLLGVALSCNAMASCYKVPVLSTIFSISGATAMIQATRLGCFLPPLVPGSLGKMCSGV